MPAFIAAGRMPFSSLRCTMPVKSDYTAKLNISICQHINNHRCVLLLLTLCYCNIIKLQQTRSQCTKLLEVGNPFATIGYYLWPSPHFRMHLSTPLCSVDVVKVIARKRQVLVPWGCCSREDTVNRQAVGPWGHLCCCCGWSIQLSSWAAEGWIQSIHWSDLACGQQVANPCTKHFGQIGIHSGIEEVEWIVGELSILWFELWGRGWELGNKLIYKSL